MSVFVLPPGFYWFGDISYVIDDFTHDDIWVEQCGMEPCCFDVMGKYIAVLKTFLEGPGAYPSLQNRFVYQVTSGFMGLVPVELIPDLYKSVAEKLGTFHHSSYPIVISCDEIGTFTVESNDMSFQVHSQWTVTS